MAARKGALVSMALALCVLLVVLIAPVSAQSSFAVDVWTGKGGQGYAAAGGSFGTNEEVVVYIWASHDCWASITIGPAGGEPGTFFDAELQGGVTVSIVPREAGSDLTGSWQVTVSAASKDGGALASDYVVFSIGATAPPPPTVPPASTPPPSAPPTSTPPATTPAAGALAQDNATALDALIALKMAEGSLPPDLDFDADGNGRVTVEDARLILRWAVQ